MPAASKELKRRIPALIKKTVAHQQRGARRKILAIFSRKGLNV